MGVETIHNVEMFGKYRGLFRQVRRTAAAQNHHVNFVLPRQNVVCGIDGRTRCRFYRCRVAASEHPHHFHIGGLTAGKLFGASTLFSDSSEYLTELKAGSDCKVFFMPSEIISELIVGEPSFALDYVAFLSGKIRFLNERLSELSAPSALQKLSSYLLKDDGRIALSKVQLASALGIGRASLYRALDDLTEKGYISSDGKSVTVIDREGLMSLI